MDNKQKMVKVKINIPTLKPDFTEDKMKEQKLQAQMQVLANLLPVGTIIDVPAEIAQAWCNETYHLSDGRMGVRNHLDVGVQDNPHYILQDNEVKYSKKIEALHEYGKKMDLATKVAITRASLMN